MPKAVLLRLTFKLLFSSHIHLKIYHLPSAPSLVLFLSPPSPPEGFAARSPSIIFQQGAPPPLGALRDMRSAPFRNAQLNSIHSI